MIQNNRNNHVKDPIHQTLLKIKIWVMVCLCSWGAAKASSYSISSPDSLLEIQVHVSDSLSWSLWHKGEALLLPSNICMEFLEGASWGVKPKLELQKTGAYSGTLNPEHYISAKIEESYNYLVLTFKDFKVEFRAFNNGAAYRFIGNLEKMGQVVSEQAGFRFADNHQVWFAPTYTYQQPFEGEYKACISTEPIPGKYSITPVTIKTANSQVCVITDVNLKSYPGMFLKKNGNSYTAEFAPVVAKETIQFAGKISPLKMPYYTKLMARKRYGYISKTLLHRTFPWRLIIVEQEEKQLLNNTLVYQLADSADRQADYTWVKPGKVVWDWYHNWKIPGVEFKSGMNNATFRYYIDFASQNGFQYINIDFSWSPLLKPDKPKKKVNLPNIIDYANNKGIGVFIWVVWYELEEKMEYYLDLFASWGVKGIKVDFMDRDDQVVVEFYHRLASETAKRKLMLNLHGAYKPAGLSRKYPNIVNREGVVGLENNKFGEACTPQHNLTLPFTRNVVGMVDYTPGAMRYVKPENYKKNWKEPHAMTTRCQQLAMYITYYAPLQMIADAPTLYTELALEFLQEIPTTWDETVPIKANIGQDLVLARRKGTTWYIAGMNAGAKKTIKTNLNFLDKGKYRARIWQDGKNLEDIEYKQISIDVNRLLEATMNSSGGFVAILEAED